MKGSHFIGILDEMKSATKARKETLIGTLLDEHFSGSQLAAELIDLMLNPYRRFHVKIAKAKGEYAEREGLCALTEGHEFDMALFNLLARLECRMSTGREAKELVSDFLSQCDGASHELLYRILKKDPRCGATASTFNKVRPGLVPVFSVAKGYPYKPSVLAKWPTPFMAEKKYNGGRTVIHVDTVAREAVPRTGNGHVVNCLLDYMPDVVESGLSDESYVLDCEFLLSDELAPLEDVMSMFRRTGTAPEGSFCLRVFAVIPMDEYMEGEGKSNAEVRRETEVAFEDALNVPHWMKPSQCWHLRSKESVDDLFSHLVSEGHEGLVLKHPDLPYVTRKSPGWQKVKSVNDADVLVVDIFEGTPGSRLEGTLGGLVVNFGGVETKVGTGFSDALRRELFNDPDLVIGKVVEVHYTDLTVDGDFQHARFHTIRHEKPPEDVTPNPVLNKGEDVTLRKGRDD